MCKSISHLIALTLLLAGAVQLTSQDELPEGAVHSGLPFQDSIVAGNSLTDEGARELEQRLVANPDDIEARATLIVHYKGEKKIAHILWLIENHPATVGNGIVDVDRIVPVPGS